MLLFQMGSLPRSNAKYSVPFEHRGLGAFKQLVCPGKAFSHWFCTAPLSIAHCTQLQLTSLRWHHWQIPHRTMVTLRLMVMMAETKRTSRDGDPEERNPQVRAVPEGKGLQPHPGIQINLRPPQLSTPPTSQ